jgi:hypothetical protein
MADTKSDGEALAAAEAGRGQPIRSLVAINVYAVLAAAVERGCAYGVERAHKHDEAPSRAAIAEACEAAVMSELCDVIVFGDGE